jgi:hypothetical protein
VAYLSKISAIALLPPLALALVAAGPAERWRTRAVRLSPLALAGAIVLPWSLRKLWLYGDPFASGAMRQAEAHIITDRSLFSRYFVTDFPRVLAKSFVGVFGWAVIVLPNWFYRPYWAFFALGAAGVAIGLRRRTIDWRLAAVLGLAGLAALAVVVRINLQFTQMQGRYLFPGFPAFAVLIALGLRSITPAVTRLASPVIVGIVLLAANLYALFAVVWPAYYPPPMRTVESGVRLIAPTHLNDLQFLGEQRYAVDGPRPLWMSPVDVDAAAFEAFEVEIASASATSPQPQRACVQYATAALAIDASPLVCAEWLADGRPHVVRMTLRGSEGWQGHVTHVRLSPVIDGTRTPGVTVWTRNPRLLPARAARSGGTP